jgi:hypothetical protein
MFYGILVHHSTQYFMFLGSTLPLLPSNVTHYLVPDCEVVRHFLEILEDDHIHGIILPQTVVQYVGSDALMMLSLILVHV